MCIYMAKRCVYVSNKMKLGRTWNKDAHLAFTLGEQAVCQTQQGVASPGFIPLPQQLAQRLALGIDLQTEPFDCCQPANMPSSQLAGKLAGKQAHCRITDWQRLAHKLLSEQATTVDHGKLQNHQQKSCSTTTLNESQVDCQHGMRRGIE